MDLFLWFSLPEQDKSAYSKKQDYHSSKGNADSESRIGEEWFRYDIDQQIGRWVQNPEVIAEKYFVENDKIFCEICGYQNSQSGSQQEKQAASHAETFREEFF